MANCEILGGTREWHYRKTILYKICSLHEQPLPFVKFSKLLLATSSLGQILKITETMAYNSNMSKYDESANDHESTSGSESESEFSEFANPGIAKSFLSRKSLKRARKSRQSCSHESCLDAKRQRHVTGSNTHADKTEDKECIKDIVKTLYGKAPVGCRTESAFVEVIRNGKSQVTVAEDMKIKTETVEFYFISFFFGLPRTIIKCDLQRLCHVMGITQAEYDTIICLVRHPHPVMYLKEIRDHTKYSYNKIRAVLACLLHSHTLSL